MAVANTLAPQQQTQEKKFSLTLQTAGMQNLLNSTLQDKKVRERFVATISSAVATNPALQKCDHMTIVSCGLVGEGLQLSPSAQLGQYYIVPYEDRKNKRIVATFQMGYKGYIQLAIRSGQYKKINVMAIKDGELVHFDPLKEEIEINLIRDYATRKEAPTIGYYARFELVNGFEKCIYWSREEMGLHAETYSPAFGKKGGMQTLEKIEKGLIPKSDLWQYSSFWFQNFDNMAFKTLLRQLISKWGIMSIEMQTAYTTDMTTDDGKGNKTYFETTEEIVPTNTIKEDYIEADEVEEVSEKQKPTVKSKKKEEQEEQLVEMPSLI